MLLGFRMMTLRRCSLSDAHWLRVPYRISPIYITPRQFVRWAGTYGSPSGTGLSDPQVGPPGIGESDPHDKPRKQDGDGDESQRSSAWHPTLFKMFESAATTFASLTVLGYVLHSMLRLMRKAKPPSKAGWIRLPPLLQTSSSQENGKFFRPWGSRA